ncbi:MAG: alkaline phosphatase family protein [Deltaproteobacteria bacterium]|nr:alkaline phosphatase family protein [Deltaproteobacteria bacterium]
MFNPEKVIVVGIDGATFDIIDELCAKGRLPNIAEIMRKGVSGRLKSTIPMISATAWTSFSTGMNPGRHGIYDFVNKVKNEYRFSVTSAMDRKSKPLWVLASEAGKKVCVVGCTLTYPPDEVNGCMISGLGTPNKKGLPACDYSYPLEVMAEIEKNVGRYRLTPNVNIKNISDAMKKEIDELIDYKARLNTYFFENHLSDFNMYFFGETDIASHFFWDDRDFIYDVYERIDRFIGGLLSRRDINIILMSDHGFAGRDRMIFVDRWLESEGLLASKPTNRFLDKLKSLGHEEDKSLSGIKWDETKAFSGRSASGSIFINLKGREPGGTVEPSDYDKVCSLISERLLQLKDPKTGVGFVEKVLRKNDIFSGEALECAPDLVPIFKKGYGVGIKSIEDRHLKDEFITDSIYWRGDHELHGIFAASGPVFNEGVRIEGAEIIDIVPTILYLYGMPINKAMDGRVLDSVFKRDFVASNPVVLSSEDIRTASGGKNLSSEEQKMIEDSLKNLGYLE